MATPGSKVLKGSSHPRWFAPLASLLVVATLGAGFVGFDALNREAPNPSIGWGGLGAAATAVLAVIALASRTKRELTVDADGIEARVGGKTTRIRWAEPHDYCFRSIAAGGTPTVQTALIRTSDGRTIAVDDIDVPGHANAGVPRLVEQHSTAANWPKLKARIEHGEDVEFGPVSVSHERIKVGSHTFPKDRPISLQVDKGLIQVGADGTWTNSGVAVRDVANYPCLLRAIGQVTQARAPV